MIWWLRSLFKMLNALSSVCIESSGHDRLRLRKGGKVEET